MMPEIAPISKKSKQSLEKDSKWMFCSIPPACHFRSVFDFHNKSGWGNLDSLPAHLLFSSLRLSPKHLIRWALLPPQAFATDGTVLQLACLERLYKVFERC